MNRPWYSEGVRFSCMKCGQCCIDHGEYAFVFLNQGEERTLARLLSLETEEFLRKYTTIVGGYVCLRNAGDACIFLENRQCKVHKARPLQCRTWPFWPENLDRETWDSEIAPACPGIGRGRLYTRERIEKLARMHMDAEPLLAARLPSGFTFE